MKVKSSGFGVDEFRVSSEFQLVIACLLFLNMTNQLSMVKSIYLYTGAARRSKYGGGEGVYGGDVEKFLKV